MNRTLQESARAMLTHAGLPNGYWAEAVSTAAYIRNRVATSALPKKTPFWDVVREEAQGQSHTSILAVWHTINKCLIVKDENWQKSFVLLAIASRVLGSWSRVEMSNGHCLQSWRQLMIFPGRSWFHSWFLVPFHSGSCIPSFTGTWSWIFELPAPFPLKWTNVCTSVISMVHLSPARVLTKINLSGHYYILSHCRAA